MKLAIINDLHSGVEREFKGEIRKLTRFSESELDAFVERVADMPDVDAVVQLGDLFEADSAELDIERYVSMLHRFDMLQKPVYHVVGNHEQRNLNDEVLTKTLGLGRLYYSFQVEGIRCIVLHSEARGMDDPMIGIEQVGWLRRELEQAPDRVIIFVHHPLDEQSLEGNVWFEQRPERCLVGNRGEVRRLFEESGKVLAVFSAHAHWHNKTLINGIPYVTLQSAVEAVGDEVPAKSWALLSYEGGTLRLQTFGYDSQEVIL